ncbi:transcription repressor OFP14 [Macadamia integrifolia]|uniref:transcription repressor OFP14 n=1 Tax=Macadamia integrifolia TaxID=60698 RepID=UPI001C501B45|nr:transcription repressor OFP14 [Macadamia integrifolia]
MGRNKNKSFQKSLQIYLSKLKKPTPSQLPIHSNSIKTSSNWILSGCRHPKTSSFSVDRNQPNHHKDGDDDDAATLTDIDRFLYENFNSLYCKTDNYNNNEGGTAAANSSPGGAFLFESPRLGEAPPDVRASNRFFVSPGTTTNSLIEESRSSLSMSDEIGSSSTTTTTTTIRESMALSAKIKSIDLNLPGDSIAVLTYTRDPYEDFRNSMEEMVQARLNQYETVDWDFMEELLFCYLKLNEKKSYKYILGAFVDLMVILRQNSSNSPAKPRKIPATPITAAEQRNHGWHRK